MNEKLGANLLSRLYGDIYVKSGWPLYQQFQTKISKKLFWWLVNYDGNRLVWEWAWYGTDKTYSMYFNGEIFSLLDQIYHNGILRQLRDDFTI